MKTRRSILIALFTFLSSTAACNGQETGAQRSSPWPAATPESTGLDADRLGALRKEARGGGFQNLHAILVVRNGQLVFEEYFADFDAETLQYTASVSKSVGSILLGIAMDRGLVPGLEAGVLDASLAARLPEHAAFFEAEPQKRRILLRHALSMTAGLEWDESSLPYSDSRNDWIRASQSDDPIGFALSRPIVAEPGAEFNYHGVFSILPSYLIQREAGRSAEAFAAEHLFGPLGITDWEWESIANGLTDTDGGLHLRPRDMAKLGQLYLNGGDWEGHRIVSEAWVEASTRRQIDNLDSPDYCLLWWCGDFHFGESTAWTFLASGHGGQKIFVLPDLDMVVVITQQVFDNPYDELNNFAIMTRYVLPATVPASRLEPLSEVDEVELSRYEGEYIGRGTPISVELRDGALFAESEDAPTIRLEPLGSGRFQGIVLDLLDVRFTFGLGDAGRPDSMRVTFGFRQDVFTRVAP